MTKTNFDRYLDEQLKDPHFAANFHAAETAWDVVLELTKLRLAAGVSQKEMAERLHTKQQNISRFESATYRGHSLKTIFDYANALGVRVKFGFEPTAQVRPKPTKKTTKRQSAK